MPRASTTSHLVSRLAGLFRRITTAGAYMPEIDGLRFIAITPVVAFHLWGYWGRIQQRAYPYFGPVDEALSTMLALGHYGVHLFFVISGFVLAMPFCKHVLDGGPAVDLRRYFWRRLTRLEPPYVVSMLIFFVAAPFAAKGAWSTLFPHLLASLGYVHELIYNEGSPINNNAWSLEIEVQFYLLMPLLAAVLWLPAIARWSVMAAVILLLSTHAAWLPRDAPRTILQYGQFFLTGVLLSDGWTTRWQTAGRSALADIPGLLAWPAFIGTNTLLGGIWADVANPWLMAALFLSALLGRWHGKLLTYGAIPFIGGMCYSIYLLHARVIAVTIQTLGDLIPHTGMFWSDYALAFGVCGAAIVVVTGCFFLAIEKPCMDPLWPRKAWEWLTRRVSRRRQELNPEPLQ